MDEKSENKSIPYVAFESTQIRHERAIKRLVTALIIAIMLIFASNAIWLYAWCQYDYSSSKSVVIDGKEGNANYADNGGTVTNGESDSN